MILNKIKRLQKKAAVYFYYSRKRKPIDIINPFFYLRALYEWHSRSSIMKIPDLVKKIDAMVKASNSTGCEYGDYYALYRSIITRKPKYVLECGSGISSCVIAYALRELKKNEGHQSIFISMEESSFYHEQVKKIFPADLTEYAKFALGERQEKRYGPLLGSFYASVPDYPYDFIFIDGPTDRKVWSDRSLEKSFNADLINILIKSTGKVSAILDQRIFTYWAFKKMLPGAKIKYSPITCLTSINNVDRSSLNKTLRMV